MRKKEEWKKLQDLITNESQLIQDKNDNEMLWMAVTEARLFVLSTKQNKLQPKMLGKREDCTKNLRLMKDGCLTLNGWQVREQRASKNALCEFIWFSCCIGEPWTCMVGRSWSSMHFFSPLKSIHWTHWWQPDITINTCAKRRCFLEITSWRGERSRLLCIHPYGLGTHPQKEGGWIVVINILFKGLGSFKHHWTESQKALSSPPLYPLSQSPGVQFSLSSFCLLWHLWRCKPFGKGLVSFTLCTALGRMLST